MPTCFVPNGGFYLFKILAHLFSAAVNEALLLNFNVIAEFTLN